MMELFHSLEGLVEAELTSADIPAALLAIAKAGIGIRNVSIENDLTARLFLPRNQYSRLCVLCQKRGDSIRCRSRRGMYWALKGMMKRKVLVTGVLMLLGLSLWLPSRVLFVEVEGNTTIPARAILEEAERCGIRFGTSRKAIRSEKIKNRLLHRMPELQWVGVNTEGCVARISVREKSELAREDPSADFGNVVALWDGVIISCTATRGTLLCREGQAVSAGEILISGYTDCGLKIQVCRAEGEIFGKTKRTVTALFPLQWQQKGMSAGQKRNYSLLIGKKRINLWKDSGIWDATCGRIYSENYITLPGGFVLPFGWSVDVLTFGELMPYDYPQTDAKTVLTEFADGYVIGQTVAGKIMRKNCSAVSREEICRLEGEYICTELIGKMQTVKIGELNG